MSTCICVHAHVYAAMPADAAEHRAVSTQIVYSGFSSLPVVRGRVFQREPDKLLYMQTAGVCLEVNVYALIQTWVSSAGVLRKTERNRFNQNQNTLLGEILFRYSAPL